MSPRLALIASLLAPLPALAQPAQLAPEDMARFAAAIQTCWNPDAGVDPAVTIRFAMTRDGMPVADSFRIVGTADERAFAAARRAVMRCAGDGYALPAAQYDLWDEVGMTFTASGIGGRA